jgi:hypothetical protein
VKEEEEGKRRKKRGRGKRRKRKGGRWRRGKWRRRGGKGDRRAWRYRRGIRKRDNKRMMKKTKETKRTQQTTTTNETQEMTRSRSRTHKKTPYPRRSRRPWRGGREMGERTSTACFSVLYTVTASATRAESIPGGKGWASVVVITGEWAENSVLLSLHAIHWK